MKSLLLITGFLLLFAAEILRVYFIMPFPGSQQQNTIAVAYWLHNNIAWIRILGLLLIIYPFLNIMRRAKLWKKILVLIVTVFYSLIFYFFNFRFLAEKIFYQPRHKTLVFAANNKVDLDKLVIGIMLNGEAKAYPVQVIGYHHQVRDTVGGTPIMVTYCTVCRTGRIFSPVVNGHTETFRLVGMDHFNAMFEDATTKSWWRQATGEAIAGSLKGTTLKELPSQQLSLESWLNKYPNSTILQPDSSFANRYEDLKDFDKGTIKGGLEKRDSASWNKKSWVIGIDFANNAKAYDWNRLVKEHMIQDSLPGLPIVIALESDTMSFHVWNRAINGNALWFDKMDAANIFMDRGTQSKWNRSGLCIEGPLKGQQLQAVQAYQEFWHSWQTFHPNTKKYE